MRNPPNISSHSCLLLLSAEREVAFQYGIGEDELRGPEVIAAVGIVLDGAFCVLLCHSNRLNGRRRLGGAAGRLGVIKKTVDIQVDAQLSYFTIIIGIEDVLLDALLLPDVAPGVLGQCAVLEHISTGHHSPSPPSLISYRQPSCA